MFNLRKRPQSSTLKTNRYWTEDENALFEEGVRLYGRHNAAGVKSHMDKFVDPGVIRSFTTTQIRTHEQKWTIRQRKREASMPLEIMEVQTPETPFDCDMFDFVSRDLAGNDWLLPFDDAYQMSIDELPPYFAEEETSSELTNRLYCQEELLHNENESSFLYCSESLDESSEMSPGLVLDAVPDFNYY